MLRGLLRGYGWVLPVALFVVGRIVIGAGGRVFTSYDTYTYSWRDDPAVDRGPVVSLLGNSPRLPGAPVFYALLPDDVWRVWAQWAIGTVAWAVLAVTLWVSLRSLLARVVAACGVLVIGLAPAMTSWDFAILSESLSISLGVLTLGLFLGWRALGWGWLLAGTAGAAVWWAFVRPETRLPVGVLALALGWFAWRGRAGGAADSSAGGPSASSPSAAAAGAGLGGGAGSAGGPGSTGGPGFAGGSGSGVPSGEVVAGRGRAAGWVARLWAPGHRGPLVACVAVLLAIGWVTAITPAVTHTFPGWSATGLSLEEETLNYRLRLQVLPSPETARVFREELGMPDCPAADAVAAGKEWAIATFADAYRSCPELKAWGEANATSSGYRYALAAPGQYLDFLGGVLPRSLAGTTYAEVGRFLPASVERLVFPPREGLAVALGVPLLLVLILAAFTRRWTLWGAAAVAVVVSAATILAGLSLSVGEYARFGIQEAAGLRIALVILVALLIDAAWSAIRARVADGIR